MVILRGAKEGEIWYLVEPESWGKGIATESVNHLLNFGFGELGLHRIWATCLPENPASARVMEKVGVPPQEPQDPRSVEEQFFVRHARRGMEACPLISGARIRISYRMTPDPWIWASHASHKLACTSETQARDEKPIFQAESGEARWNSGPTLMSKNSACLMLN